MSTQEEKEAFGKYDKYLINPYTAPIKKKPNTRGQLYYNKELIYENTWALCQVEKKRLLNLGCGYKANLFELKNIR